MHSWQGGGVILTMMRTVTTATKTTAIMTMNEDNDKETNGKDNNDLIFLTQQPTCGQMHSWQGGG